jgi:hypothetical protein
MRGRRQLLIVALCCLWAVAAAAQNGSLAGRVTDKDTGEQLIAVDIMVVGTGRATQTDLEGGFLLAGLPAGIYDVRVSYLGYTTRVLPGVVVEAGARREVEIQLVSFRANAIDDVMVTATRVLSTESAVLADRKNAAVVGDAISAAQISRSPDSQAGDALKRVTGLTVVDGGYVNVRGMPDRYNVTVVDGAVATSVDPDLDRKSFNFEMIPSNLLASLQVLKTALPNMPGDFTGGLVKVNTVEFPEQATTRFGISYTATEGVTSQDFIRDAYSGGNDRWGFDDGGRDRPQQVIDAGRLPNDGIAYQDAVARALPNRWGTESATSPPEASFSLSHGNRFDVLGRRVGVVGAVTYKNDADITDTYKAYDPTSEWFESTDYRSEIDLGVLLNLNVDVAERQTISIKNLYGHHTEESFLAANKLGNQLSYRHVLEWEEKAQLTSNVMGSHGLPLGDLTWNWRVFYNENTAKEPDLRYLEYHLETEPVSMLTNRRHWLYVDEFARGVDSSLKWVLGDVDRPTSVEGGVMFSTRRRSLENNPYHMARDDLSGGLVFLPPEDIFAPENFKEGLFTLRYQDQFEGSYAGRQAVNAYYLMADTPFDVMLEEFRFAGGVRLENNQYAVDAFDKVTDTFTDARMATTNLLPSANLTYFYDEQTNVRMAYYRSVNYPEMREIAPVKSNDFKNDWQVEGNPDLKPARIDNYDLRVEYFPSYGEVFAVSFFYKDLQDAIETSLNSQPNYLDLLSWFNGDGRNYGLELEMRTSLDFLSRSLNDVTIHGNYTRVWSEVDFETLENPDQEGESARLRSATRQLQGQAPWVVNLGVKWEDKETGWSAGVLYNRVGRRLKSVSYDPFRNIYEEPRHLLDAVITKRLYTRASLKFTVKNILGEETTWIHDVDQGAGDRVPQELPYGYKSGGTSTKLSFSVKF